MEQGPSYVISFPDFRITWPESEIGQVVTESCGCGDLDITDINYRATRTCGGNYSSGATWGPQDVSNCTFSDATLQLCQTTEVSKAHISVSAQTQWVNYRVKYGGIVVSVMIAVGIVFSVTH